MQHVFVLNHDYTPLSPCTPERARKLLDDGRVAMYRMFPFTIIFKEQVAAGRQPAFTLKFDPGAKTTGIAIVRNDKEGSIVIWAAELGHKSFAVKDSLASRKALRRGRRQRNTRYRRCKFGKGQDASFGREDGWVAPSIRSRVDNIQNWFVKLFRLCPITAVSTENVRFDTQLMVNPEISDIGYQQGELQGYEVREYLLEKFNRRCCYCGKTDVRLEIEHIMPKSRGGSDRVSNLCLACRPCNQRKGNRTAAEFGHPQVEAAAKRPLKDAAGVNIIRWKIYEMLKQTGLPVESGTGGRTKFNRTRQGYPKTHWIDAACVGESGRNVRIDLGHRPLLITAIGRGSRQATRVNKYGFPAAAAKSAIKRKRGYATGDIVKFVNPRGKYVGTYIMPITSANDKSFDMRPNGSTADPANFYLIQRNDGYRYQIGGIAGSI